MHPESIINPIYNGTKSFVHAWTTVQRTVLSQTAPHIKVVEIVPPSVGTDLHRERLDKDDNKKEKGANSLTVEEFMEEFKQGVENNQDEIGAGPAHGLIKAWQDAFGGKYKEAADKYKR